MVKLSISTTHLYGGGTHFTGLARVMTGRLLNVRIDDFMSQEKLINEILAA